MKGRRIFDHVDPYLAPPEHDPPEPPECDWCAGVGVVLDQHLSPQLCPDCGGTGDRP